MQIVSYTLSLSTNNPHANYVYTRPYSESEIICLDAGSSGTRFLVHSLMLQKSAPLSALYSKGRPLSLPNLDAAAAHTLVHYLYAGTFETRSEYAAFARFRHSTCVYCAAVRYQLPSLAVLSKGWLIQAGGQLSIADILKVARDDAFPLLPHGDTWYSEYLEGIIRKAMSEDPEPFRRPDFITKVEGNSRLLQVVWKIVMSSYAVVPAPVSVENGAETPLAESMLTDSEAPTQDSMHQLPSPTESVLDSPPVSKATTDMSEPVPLDLISSASEKFKPAELISHTELNPIVQTSTTLDDDLGLPAIEPTIDHSEVLETVAAKPRELKEPKHVRNDSVVEVDAELPSKGFDHAKRESISEAAPIASTSIQETPKKSKKKSKKKSSSIVF